MDPGNGTDSDYFSDHQEEETNNKKVLAYMLMN